MRLGYPLSLVSTSWNHKIYMVINWFERRKVTFCSGTMGAFLSNICSVFATCTWPWEFKDESEIVNELIV